MDHSLSCAGPYRGYGRTCHGVVDKPFPLYPVVPSSIHGFSSPSDETLTKPWPCLHITLAVGETLNANT